MSREVIRVVIITFNSAADIAACLDALALASVEYALDICVVDNGSSDGTLGLLRERYPSVHAIASDNFGFAHGCNLALRESLADQRDDAAILFLNPDATLPQAAIDRLMEVLRAVPDAGGISPRNIESSDNVECRPRTLFGLTMPRLSWPGREILVSDRLHGNCMLVRQEVFRKIGFFDEDYFLYWEELDFGLRALDAGYKLLLLQDVAVYHRYGAEERPHRVYYMWRNQYRFARMNFTAGRRALFLARRALSQVRDLTGFLLSGRHDLAWAAVAGLRAGLRGETGRGASCYAVPVVRVDG